MGLLGAGVLSTASQTKFKNIILTIGGLCYLLGAVCAYIYDSWWALLAGFLSAIIINFIGKK